MNKEPMIKVMIADDHQMVIDGLKSLLAYEKTILPVSQALNGQQVLDNLKEQPVDLVVLDINMPVMDGLETTRLIREKFPEVKVLILTMYNEKDFISNLLETGASGYILKNTGREEFIEAIKTIHQGGTFYSSAVTQTIMQSLHTREKEKKQDPVPITRRELDVLRLIVGECTTSEIAEQLFISQHTVETHRKNLLSKLNVRNTAGLVRYAIKKGIVEG